MVGGSPKCRSWNISRNYEKARSPISGNPQFLFPMVKISVRFSVLTHPSRDVLREWYIIFVMVEIYFKILNIHSGLYYYVLFKGHYYTS